MNGAEWMKGICHCLGADISLPHCLETAIWSLAHKSDHRRADISENIARFDALATRPEILLYWRLVSACVVSLELKFLPYSWEKFSRMGHEKKFKLPSMMTTIAILLRISMIKSSLRNKQMSLQNGQNWTFLPSFKFSYFNIPVVCLIRF